MAESVTVPITGQCHCGAVKYLATGQIIHQGECSCRACQRATGTLGSPNLGVEQANFQVVRGKPSQFKSKSNEGCEAGTFNFCGECGAPLFWRSPDGYMVGLLVGSLNDMSLYKKES